MPSADNQSAAGVSEDHLQCLIHHVFLTPSHPQKMRRQNEFHDTEMALLGLVLKALTFFKSRVTAEAGEAVDAVYEAVAFLHDSKEVSSELDQREQEMSSDLDQHKLEQVFARLLKKSTFPRKRK